MKRRQFLMSTAAAIGAELFAPPTRGSALAMADASARTYRILGVPLRAGSLLPGNENDAEAYREVQFLKRLQAAGCKAVDDGDVAIPSYLPHHSVPPIRNWPAPRIAWECVRDRVEPLLRQPNQVPLLIGCDCSVVIGTTEALMRASGQDVHVLYVDGDFDDAAPEPGRCQSAASCAVWLLTHESPFWSGPPLPPSQVSVFGWTNPSRSKLSGTSSTSLARHAAIWAPGSCAADTATDSSVRLDTAALRYRCPAKAGVACRLLSSHRRDEPLRGRRSAQRIPERSTGPYHRSQ